MLAVFSSCLFIQFVCHVLTHSLLSDHGFCSVLDIPVCLLLLNSCLPDPVCASRCEFICTLIVFYKNPSSCISIRSLPPYLTPRRGVPISHSYNFLYLQTTTITIKLLKTGKSLKAVRGHLKKVQMKPPTNRLDHCDLPTSIWTHEDNGAGSPQTCTPFTCKEKAKD